MEAGQPKTDHESEASSIAKSTIPKKPNIILVYVDDISARELPIYESSVWTTEKSVDTSDKAFQAKTHVLDQVAREGCWVEAAWSSVRQAAR